MTQVSPDIRKCNANDAGIVTVEKTSESSLELGIC